MMTDSQAAMAETRAFGSSTVKSGAASEKCEQEGKCFRETDVLAPIPMQVFAKFDHLSDLFNEIEKELCQDEASRLCLQQKIQTQDKFIEDLRSRMEGLNRSKQHLSSQLDQWRDECNRLKQQDSELRRELQQKCQEEHKHFQDIEQLNRKVAALEASLKDKERQCSEIGSKLTSTQRELENMKGGMQKLQGTNANLMSDLACKQSNLKHTQSCLIDRMEEVRDLKTQVDTLNAQIAAAESVNSLTTKNTDRILAEFSELKCNLESKRQQCSKLQRELDVVLQKERVCKELQASLEVVEKEKSALATALEAIQSTLQERLDAASRLAEEKATAIRELESKMKGLDSANEDMSRKIIDLTKELEHARTALQDATRHQQESDAASKRLLEAGTAENLKLSTQISEANTRLAGLELKLLEAEQATGVVAEEKDRLSCELHQLRMSFDEAQERLKQTDKCMSDMKRDYQRQLQTKQGEIQKHLYEINKRNAAAMAQIKKDYETEATKVVNKEKERANLAVSEAQAEVQKVLSEEKEKCASRIKSLMEKHSAQIEEMEQQHGEQILSLQQQLAEVISTKESWKEREEEIMAAVDALKEENAQLRHEGTSLKEFTEKLKAMQEENRQMWQQQSRDKETEYTSALQQLREVQKRELSQVAEKLKKAEEKEVGIVEKHERELRQAQVEYDQNLAQVEGRLKEAERRLRQQQASHEGMVQAINEDLERCLHEANEKLSVEEESRAQLMREFTAKEKSLTLELEKAKKNANTWEEKCSSIQIEVETIVERLRMEHGNSLKKHQMEAENAQRKKDLEHESAVATLRMDYENLLKAKTVELESTLRKLKAEQHENSKKAVSECVVGGVRDSSQLDKADMDVIVSDFPCPVEETPKIAEEDGLALGKASKATKKRASSKKATIRLQPMTSSDCDDVMIRAPTTTKQADTLNLSDEVDAEPLSIRKKRVKAVVSGSQAETLKGTKIAKMSGKEAFKSSLSAEDPYAF